MKDLNEKETTLAIIKPDAVKGGLVGKIIQFYDEAGLEIEGVKFLTLSKAEAEGFYAVHRERPFFPSLVEFMTSGPCMIFALKGPDCIDKVRAINGATDPKKAEKGTIRALYGTDIQHNVVHGSDSSETAQWEVAYFFPDKERRR